MNCLWRFLKLFCFTSFAFTVALAHVVLLLFVVFAKTLAIFEVQ
jgi:hypothetical protein